MLAAALVVAVVAVGVTGLVVTLLPARTAAAVPLVRVAIDDVDVSELVAGVREVARDVEGAQPDRPLQLTLIDEVDPGDSVTAGRAHTDGRIYVRRTLGDGMGRVIVHEVAHVLTPGDGHGPVWCELFVRAVDELLDGGVSVGMRAQLRWQHDDCNPGEAP